MNEHGRGLGLLRTAGPATLALLLGAASVAARIGVANAADFPDPSLSYLKTGDFIAPERVRLIHVGMSKDQVRLELGNPHFKEGFFAVREWNYIFNLAANSSGGYLACQYRVSFDAKMRVADTAWNLTTCRDLVESAAPATARNPP